MVNSAASRLYYAVFQAVKGFGIMHGDMTMDEGDRVHAKVITLVGTHGKGRSWARERVSELFSLRVRADYTPETLDVEELREIMGDAEKIRATTLSWQAREETMIETQKNQVRDILATAFPEFHVQFEAIGDDPNTICVGVYGVPKVQVKWVKKKIHELDATFFADTGYVLVPMVRDLETTRRHYPHLLRNWKASPADVFNVLMDPGIGDPTLENYGPTCRQGVWRKTPATNATPHDSAAQAANEELALAA